MKNNSPANFSVGVIRCLSRPLVAAGLALVSTSSSQVFAATTAESFEQFFAENVSFSGRLHPQYDYLESELSGTDVPDPAVAKRDYFRRVMAGVKIDFSKKLRLNYLTDVSDRVVKNQVARIEWKLSESDKIHLGYEKAPFGFEDTTSSAKVKPIERSANTRFWNEVVGIGSYHSGLYYYHNFEDGLSSVLGVTHNVKADSEVPDLFSGDVSLYSRFSKKGKTNGGTSYQTGLDLGYQPSDKRGDVFASSLFANFSVLECDVALEATLGDIELAGGNSAFATGWHAQLSRMLGGEKLEGVVRISRVDTDGYQLKLSSAVRKAPYSGFKYEEVDSLYLGANYYLDGNDIKLSFGYELAEARNALSGTGPLDEVEETVSGFRVRGQFLF